MRLFRWKRGEATEYLDTQLVVTALSETQER